MLEETTTRLEETLHYAIMNQVEYYAQVKRDTFRKILGQLDSNFTLAQHFKYQASIGETLREMERTYFDYFGKPWDYVEPITEKELVEEDSDKPKRGRPRKQI